MCMIVCTLFTSYKILAVVTVVLYTIYSYNTYKEIQVKTAICRAKRENCVTELEIALKYQLLKYNSPLVGRCFNYLPLPMA